MNIPTTSANIYAKHYDTFISWCQSNDMKEITEDVLITYMTEKSVICKSSTLKKTYCILKSTLLTNDNIDITGFKRLFQFIKTKSVGYKSKPANVFTRMEIKKFLTEAPDCEYLLCKVCLIFGIYGACRKEDLKKIDINQIKDKGDILIVTTLDSKFGPRKFTISDKLFGNVNVIELYRKYLALRPPETPHHRLFISYQMGKCTTVPMGYNSFGKIPKMIAVYLKLPDSDGYTVSTFRRTSACFFKTFFGKRKQNINGSELGEKSQSSTSHDQENVELLPSFSGEILYNMKYINTPDSENDSMSEGSKEEDYTENECEDSKNPMISVTENPILFNKEEPDKMSAQNITAVEYNVFGEYISQHLQQLPTDIALKLQLKIHDLVLQTRLEHVRNHPSEAPLIVKQENVKESADTIAFENIADNNLNNPNKCINEQIRDEEPPNPTKRPKQSFRDPLATGSTNKSIDLDGFAKHITLQLGKLPEDVTLQLQLDIYNLIQQTCKLPPRLMENHVNIKKEIIPELFDQFDEL